MGFFASVLIWVVISIWFMYRVEVVLQYRFAMIDRDMHLYMRSPSFMAIFFNPIRFPARKMKKFINDRNS